MIIHQENERLQKQWKEEEKRTKGLKPLSADDRLEPSEPPRSEDESSANGKVDEANSKSRGKSFRKRREKKDENKEKEKSKEKDREMKEVKEDEEKSRGLSFRRKRQKDADKLETSREKKSATPTSGNAAVIAISDESESSDGSGLKNSGKLTGGSSKEKPKSKDKKAAARIKFRVNSVSSPEKDEDDTSSVGSHGYESDTALADMPSGGDMRTQEQPKDDGISSHGAKKKGHSRSRSVGTFIPGLANPFGRREEDDSAGSGGSGSGPKNGTPHFPSLLSPRRMIVRDRDKELEREKEKREKELRAFLGDNDMVAKRASEEEERNDSNRVFGVELKALLHREGHLLPDIASNAIIALFSEGGYLLRCFNGISSPLTLHFCIRPEALNTVGIFRVTSSKAEIEDLINALDTRAYARFFMRRFV